MTTNFLVTNSISNIGGTLNKLNSDTREHDERQLLSHTHLRCRKSLKVQKFDHRQARAFTRVEQNEASHCGRVLQYSFRLQLTSPSCWVHRTLCMSQHHMPLYRTQ